MVIYRAGDCFRLINPADESSDCVMLVQTRANMMQLITLTSGNRWNDTPCRVVSPNEVFALQLRAMVGETHNIEPDVTLPGYLKSIA